MTPGLVEVATGKATPGKVCAGAKVMTPVIVPPAFGSAAVAVTCAAAAASLATLTAVGVAASVLLVRFALSES